MVNISPSEISIVIQGPIFGKPDAPEAERWTWRGLESLRTFLPGSEIILSTWKGADATGLTYDVLLENDDPGPYRYEGKPEGPGAYNNVNRQIVSSREGLKAATRPFALKVRSDMIFRGAGFLDYWGRYEKRSDDWKIFGERILACTVFSTNPHRMRCYPFHPSDWAHFGRREDVLELWDLPLQTEKGILNLLAEQLIWTGLLKKHGPLTFNYMTDTAHDAIRISELTIANNLALLAPEQWQMTVMKWPDVSYRPSIYTHGEWVRLYNRYCGGQERVPFDVSSLAASAISSASRLKQKLRGASA